MFMELTQEELDSTDGGNAVVDALIKIGAWVASHPELFIMVV